MSFECFFSVVIHLEFHLFPFTLTHISWPLSEQWFIIDPEYRKNDRNSKHRVAAEQVSQVLQFDLCVSDRKPSEFEADQRVNRSQTTLVRCVFMFSIGPVWIDRPKPIHSDGECIESHTHTRVDASASDLEPTFLESRGVETGGRRLHDQSVWSGQQTPQSENRMRKQIQAIEVDFVRYSHLTFRKIYVKVDCDAFERLVAAADRKPLIRLDFWEGTNQLVSGSCKSTEMREGKRQRSCDRHQQLTWMSRYPARVNNMSLNSRR